jgi:hypothetical protein
MQVHWLTENQIQNFGLWLQSGAIVFSLVGVIIGIVANRRIARRRATLDLIMQDQTHQALVKLRQDFIALRETGNLVQWAAPAQAASAQQTTLRAIMNRYELIAIGISEKTLDRGVYRRYARTTLVKDWLACKPWVMQMRQNSNTPTYYCEIEKIAKKWAHNSERPHC